MKQLIDPRWGRTDTEASARARARLAEGVAAGAAPGLQYALVSAGGTLVEEAAGWADVAGRRPLEPGTTMMAYSMTKTVTAVAVLQLVERGAVSLDAPLTAYVPETPYGDGVRIRHLLAQTSGIPDPIPLRWVHPPEAHASFDERAMLRRRLAERPRLRFAPGTRYAYSNLSYWLLGQVVERASGTGYQAYVKAHLLGPLGVQPAELGFVIPDPGRHARGYLPRWSSMNLLGPLLVDRRFLGGCEGRWRHVEDAYLDGAAFGGIVASARAMARLLQDLLRPTSVLLGPEGRRLLTAPQTTSAGRPTGTTLGWHLAPGDRGFLFKEGGGAGFHCEMRLYPTRGLGTIAMGNSGAFDVKRLLARLDGELVG